MKIHTSVSELWVRRIFKNIGLRHVILAGLVVRLLVFAILPDQNFGDARVYVETGRALATTGFMSSFIYMPLYPLWTWVWGGAWGVKLGDILISTATIWLMWRLAEIVVQDRAAAALSGMVAAIYPHFLFYAVSGLSETLFAFVLIGSFICFYRQRFAWGAVLLVLTILIRPTLDLLAPVLVGLFVVVVHRLPARQAVLRIGQYACIYVVLMAPWWVHNYARYGEFVRLNLGDGIVLYSGNNPLNTSGGGVVDGEKGSDVDLAPFYRIADPVERDDSLKRAAWRFIKENPRRFVELAGVKFTRFWRLWPYAAEYERPGIVIASVMSYGLFLLLALLYLPREGRRNFRLLVPIFALTLYLTLVHMATIGSIRYRFPLEPFIIVLGSAEAVILGRRHAVLRRVVGLTCL